MFCITVMEYYSAIKKDQTADTCINMDEPQKALYYMKEARHQRLYLTYYKNYRKCKAIETESTSVVIQGRR